MSPDIESLWCFFEYESDEIDAEYTWTVARENLTRSDSLESDYYFDGDIKRKLKYIDKHSQFHRDFLLTGDNLNISTSGVFGGQYRNIVINQEKPFFTNWDDWANPYSRSLNFTMGFCFNSEYFWWQTEEKQETYERNGKSWSHLKEIPTGFHKPLPQTKLDTSTNVGHFVIRKGYVEAVMAHMWLGDRFFDLTGASKEAVMNTDWLTVDQIHPHVIKIQAQEKPFTMDTGKERELQIALRDLLYPNYKEQPPT